MHLICEVVKDSVAFQAGLKQGEYLACINGEDVMHAPHDYCVSKIKNSADKVELTVAAKQVMELFYTHGITATSKANYDHLWNQHSFAFTNDAFVDVQQKDLSDRVVEESSCKQEEQHSTLYVPGAISDNDLDENTPTNSTSQPKRNSFTNSKGECSKTFSSNLKYYTIQKEQSQFGFDVVFDRNVNCHSVYYVNAESPAEKAGIQVGDKVVEVNGQNIQNATYEDVRKFFASHSNQISLGIRKEAIASPSN